MNVDRASFGRGQVFFKKPTIRSGGSRRQSVL